MRIHPALTASVAVLALAGCNTVLVEPAQDGCGYGDCAASLRVELSLVTYSGLSHASLSLWAWSEDGPHLEITEQVGGCRRAERVSGPGFVPASLAVGEAMILAGDEERGRFPPPGRDGPGLTSMPLLAQPGEVLTLRLAGGADLPAVALDVEVPLAAEVETPEPMIAGEPWSLAWLAPAGHLVQLFLPVEGEAVSVSCTAEADAGGVTVPAEVTASLPAPWNGMTHDVTLFAGPAPSRADLDGAVVEVRALHGSHLLVRVE
ncbi:MAG: hypothetical protein R3B72_20325 [Polyangiaceae bacterium]